ncbi:MAG: hypothetical protein ACRDP1_09440 [Nocardioidaceae bacterium]
MSRLRAFGAFLWDFIVGDDWRIAVGVIVTLGVVALLVHADVNVWWLTPIAVVVILAESLRRGTRSSG